MKTKLDLTQFEDNSDSTTCTVSVIYHEMKILLHVTSAKIWPESGMLTVNIAICMKNVITDPSYFSHLTLIKHLNFLDSQMDFHNM